MDRVQLIARPKWPRPHKREDGGGLARCGHAQHAMQGEEKSKLRTGAFVIQASHAWLQPR